MSEIELLEEQTLFELFLEIAESVGNVVEERTVDLVRQVYISRYDTEGVTTDLIELVVPLYSIAPRAWQVLLLNVLADYCHVGAIWIMGGSGFCEGPNTRIPKTGAGSRLRILCVGHEENVLKFGALFTPLMYSLANEAQLVCSWLRLHGFQTKSFRRSNFQGLYKGLIVETLLGFREQLRESGRGIPPVEMAQIARYIRTSFQVQVTMIRARYQFLPTITSVCRERGRTLDPGQWLGSTIERELDKFGQNAGIEEAEIEEAEN